MKNPLKSEIALPTDYELLVRISWKDDPEMESDSSVAFGDFYNRHKEYMMRVTCIVCSKFVKDYGNEIVQDIFNNTFKQIFEKAGVVAQAMEKHEGCDENFIRKKMRAYLGKMAENELMQYIRHEGQYKDSHALMDDMTLLQEFDCSDAEDVEEGKINFNSKEKDAIKSGLLLLKDRERDILIESTRYQKDGKDLPDEIIAELCARWDILPGNFRVIKHRALKKLEQYAKGQI